MLSRNSLLGIVMVASMVYGQMRVEKPPEGGIAPPPVDIRERERENVGRATGGQPPVLNPVEVAPPPPPPAGTPPQPPPPPPAPAINLKDLRRKTFDIKMGQNLREKEKNNAVAGREAEVNALSGLQEQTQQGKTYSFKGICRSLDDIEVVLEPQMGRVECLINRKIYRGYMQYEPQVERYALRAKLVELGGKRIDQSEVWTADRRSQNVASEVDARLISNILLIALRNTGQETAEVAKQAFRPEQRIITPGGGSLVIIEQDTKKTLRNLPEYALYSAIANLIGVAADEVLAGRKRLPPLFKVRKGQEFYVEASFCEGCR